MRLDVFKRIYFKAENSLIFFIQTMNRGKVIYTVMEKLFIKMYKYSIFT